MEVIYGVFALLGGLGVWFCIQLSVWSLLIRTAGQAHRCMALVGGFAIGAPLLVFVMNLARYFSGQDVSVAEFLIVPTLVMLVFVTSLVSLDLVRRRRKTK
jgi:hypothetical protein